MASKRGPGHPTRGAVAATERLTVRLTPAAVALLDERRGKTPRAVYVAEMVETALRRGVKRDERRRDDDA